MIPIEDRLALAEEQIAIQARLIMELTDRLNAISRPYVIGPTEKQASTEHIASIAEKVARAHGLALEALIGHGLGSDVCAARDEACYLLRLAHFSTPRIGRFFNRDSSSIHTASKRHMARLAKGG